MPLWDHVKGCAWKSTSVLNATRWMWPSKLLGQDCLPIRHMEHGMARRQEWSDDLSQCLCQVSRVLSSDPALERPVWETNSNNRFMCARWVRTGSGRVADSRSIGHKHPCFGPVFVKLTGTSLRCEWRNGMYPVIHATIVPRHG